MNLLESIIGELFGRKLTAKQRRGAEREATELLNMIAYGPAGPPPLIQTTDGQNFRYVGWGPVPPRGTHLCGVPPVLHQNGTGKRAPHNCHVYAPAPPGRLKNPRPFYPPGTTQVPPPPPARPSRASEIHDALGALGIHQAARTVWPPPASEIRATFVALSKQHHPDRNPGNAEAEAHYKQITAAYALLKGEGIA